MDLACNVVAWEVNYPIYDTFYLTADSLGEQLKVLRQKSVPLNEKEIIQISHVVVGTVPLTGDEITMYVKEILSGADECVVDTTSLSEKEVRENYSWFFED